MLSTVAAGFAPQKKLEGGERIEWTLPAAA